MAKMQVKLSGAGIAALLGLDDGMTLPVHEYLTDEGWTFVSTSDGRDKEYHYEYDQNITGAAPVVSLANAYNMFINLAEGDTDANHDSDSTGTD